LNALAKIAGVIGSFLARRNSLLTESRTRSRARDESRRASLRTAIESSFRTASESTLARVALS
jgi:hypothetical protein